MTVNAALAAAGARPDMRYPAVKYVRSNTTPITSTAQWVKSSGAGGASSNTGVASAVANDGSDYLGGQVGYVHMTSPGQNGTTWGMNLGTTWDFTGKYLRALLRNMSINGPGTVQWQWAASRSAMIAGNYLKWNLSPLPGQTAGLATWLPKTWVHDSVHPSFLTAVGSGADLTAIGYIGLMCKSVTGGTDSDFSFDIGALELVTCSSTKAKVTIWHDDTVADGLDDSTNNPGFATKMAAYGFPLQEATEWEMIGAGGGFLTTAAARAYANSGAVVFGSHATTNPEHNSPLTPADPSHMQNQTVRNNLAARKFNFAGQSPGDHALWGSQPNGQTFNDMIRQYYRTYRTTTSSLQIPDMLPPAEPWCTKAVLANQGDTFAGTWQPIVDAAIATKGWAQFCFHQQIGEGGASGRTEFDNLLSYLNTKQQAGVLDVVGVPAALASCT